MQTVHRMQGQDIQTIRRMQGQDIQTILFSRAIVKTNADVATEEEASQAAMVDGEGGSRDGSGGRDVGGSSRDVGADRRGSSSSSTIDSGETASTGGLLFAPSLRISLKTLTGHITCRQCRLITRLSPRRQSSRSCTQTRPP